MPPGGLERTLAAHRNMKQKLNCALRFKYFEPLISFVTQGLNGMRFRAEALERLAVDLCPLFPPEGKKPDISP